VTLGTDVLLDDKDEFLLDTLRQDVCIGRKNVLVISEEEFYLDAIFLRLYNALKDTQGLAVHRMFQPDVEGIVGWFNKLLAEVSIDEARNLGDQPKTIIFMPEITNANIQEWISCESLIGAFPGANVSLIAFGRADKINTPAVANVAAKRQNSVVRLPRLSPERVELYFREAKKFGELSVLLSTLSQSPWRDLAQTIHDEMEPEVEASISNEGTFDARALDESSGGDPNESENANNLVSDDEFELQPNERSWFTRFALMTSVLFVIFLSLIFGLDFMYGSDQGAQIIQSVTDWLDWSFSLLKQLIDWAEAFFSSSTSTP
jgi:hypothetical protein